MSPIQIQVTRPNKTLRCPDGKIRRSARGRDYKAQRAAKGEAVCDGCGWAGTLTLRAIVSNWWTVFNAHHVIPLAYKGKDHQSNMVLLCPTCHTLAHLIDQDYRVDDVYVWTGPADADELLAALRALSEADLSAKGYPFATPQARSGLRLEA